MKEHPTKKAEKVPHVTAQVVGGGHRIAAGSHSAVFPSHIGTNHFHPGPRQGHGGSHSVKSKGR